MRQFGEEKIEAGRKAGRERNDLYHTSPASSLVKEGRNLNKTT